MKEGSGNGTSLIDLMFSVLDPDYFKSLGLGTVWNLYEGPGLL
jgi:hypothetical protein